METIIIDMWCIMQMNLKSLLRENVVSVVYALDSGRKQESYNLQLWGAHWDKNFSRDWVVLRMIWCSKTVEVELQLDTQMLCNVRIEDRYMSPPRYWQRRRVWFNIRNRVRVKPSMRY